MAFSAFKFFFKFNFGRGSAPDPAGGADDAPPETHSWMERGKEDTTHLPISHPLDSFDVEAR